LYEAAQASDVAKHCRLENIPFSPGIYKFTDSSSPTAAIQIHPHNTSAEANFTLPQKDKAEATSQWMLLRPDIMT
jgi:hypothetical protein